MRKSLWLFLATLSLLFTSCTTLVKEDNPSTFRILSSSENTDLEHLVMDYAKSAKLDVQMDFVGSLEIPYSIESNPGKYDAVWNSNSIWNTQIPNLKNSRSICINPVIFAVSKTKYEALGFNRNTMIGDIVGAVKAKKLQFLMPSVTSTNSGASAYLGFLNNLAGAPPVLTSENLKDATLQENLKTLFSGVVRNSGSDEYLIDVFKNGNYDSLVSYEASLLELNAQLTAQGKEPLIFIYPPDGVSLSDSPFAYLDNNNEDKLKIFQAIQHFLLSNETQEKLDTLGHRTNYGGLETNAAVYKPEYGIPINEYLSPIKYPSAAVIQEALALYQEIFRKPSATVFVLDYSGSMYGDGQQQLTDAMNYLLHSDLASAQFLQFTPKDQVGLILFSDYINRFVDPAPYTDEDSLLNIINTTGADGGTDIYNSTAQAYEMLSSFSPEDYTRSIILMTDGDSNHGRLSQLKNQVVAGVPVFSIMFGDANPKQLDDISKLTSGKTFDGRKNLLQAFKEIRAYN